MNIYQFFDNDIDVNEIGEYRGYTLKVTKTKNKYTGQYGCYVFVDSGTVQVKILHSAFGNTPDDAIAAAKGWIEDIAG